MIICDLPVAGHQVRAAVFGSCRVHNPILALGAQGSLRVLSYLHPYSHTLAGAIHLIDLVDGRAQLATDLQPFVLGEANVGSWAAKMLLNKPLLASCEILIIEVCTDGQLMFGEVALHPTFFTDVLAPKLGGAVQEWVRSLVTLGSASTETVDRAIAQADECGHLTPYLAEIIRSARGVRYTEADLRNQLRLIRELHPGRILLVSHLVDPADTSAPMQRRRRQTERLRALIDDSGINDTGIDATGLSVFDPSALFNHLSRAAVFREAGTDINEYAPSVVPKVGRALVTAATCPDQPAHMLIASAVADRNPVTTFRTRRPSATLEARLRDILAERLAALGRDESGLGSYYEAMIQQDSLFSERGIAAFDYIVRTKQQGMRINHVGATIGELPIALAAARFRVRAHIKPKRRFEAAQAMRLQLESEGLLPTGCLQVTREPLPTKKAALFVGIDARFDQDKLSNEMLLNALFLHPSALIEPQNLGLRRDSDADWMELFALLETEGYRGERHPIGENLVYVARARQIGWLQQIIAAMRRRRAQSVR